jgi:hypothetical protein
VLVAQCPVGVDRALGAGQVRGRPLDLEHAGQVPVVGDVAAQAAGRGERLGGDAVPGSDLDQFGGVRADLLPGRGRQVRWLGRRLARVRRSTGPRDRRPLRNR